MIGEEKQKKCGWPRKVQNNILTFVSPLFRSFSVTGNTDPNPLTSAYMSTPTLSQLSNANNYQAQQTSNSAAVAAAHAHAAAAASNASNMAMTPTAAAAAAGKQMEGKFRVFFTVHWFSVGGFLSSFILPPQCVFGV